MAVVERLVTDEPVMLKPEEHDLWLESSNDDQNLLTSMMRPYEDGMLEIYEVSRDVNSPKHDEARFIEPVKA